jgi:hypothetical protein
MANPEHLKKLDEGVNAWNAWMLQNLTLTLDLSGTDLCGADLYKADLRGVDLRGDQPRAVVGRAEVDFTSSNPPSTAARFHSLLSSGNRGDFTFVGAVGKIRYALKGPPSAISPPVIRAPTAPVGVRIFFPTRLFFRRSTPRPEEQLRFRGT